MLKKLFVHQSDHIAIQFIRYGIVAAIAFIIDFGLLYVFTAHAHIFYLLSSILSFSISLIPNYFLSVAWVFSRSAYRRSIEVTAFIIINFIGLGLNTLIIWFCTSQLGIYYLISKLIAVAIVFFWSFTARRYFLFRKRAMLEQDE